MKVAVLLSLVLLASGCELILGIEDASSDDGSDGIDPEPPREDAGTGGTDQLDTPLGLLCGSNHLDNGFDGQCPGGGFCVVEFADWFDPEFANGFCTFECFDGDASPCIQNYQGPPEGQPICVSETEAPDAAGLCGVACEGEGSDFACPMGLICLPFTIGDTFIGSGCGGPTWVQQSGASD